MVSATNFAAYIANRYTQDYGERIDEMKLHKLLYLAQRESFVQTGKPLFNELFQGWKFGPVMVGIRDLYRRDALGGCDANIPDDAVPVLDEVFKRYAGQDSWSLSRLTHGEYSWAKSRENIADGLSGDVFLKTDDIRVDAEAVKERREKFKKLASMIRK